MKVTGSHLIVQALRAEGIDQIFTLAGDHTLHLMDVMAAAEFKFIDTRHEQAAVYMTNAWGGRGRPPPHYTRCPSTSICVKRVQEKVISQF